MNVTNMSTSGGLSIQQYAGLSQASSGDDERWVYTLDTEDFNPFLNNIQNSIRIVREENVDQRDHGADGTTRSQGPSSMKRGEDGDEASFEPVSVYLERLCFTLQSADFE